MKSRRAILLVIGAAAIVGIPLLGVAAMRAFNAFVWLCLTAGFCAGYVLIAGTRRESAMLVPLLVLSPAAPIAVWLAVDPALSIFASWRPFGLVAAAGMLGWLFAHVSPAIASWRADRRTTSAIYHARDNIEALLAEWGPEIAKPYAPRAGLPARVGNLA